MSAQAAAKSLTCNRALIEQEGGSARDSRQMNVFGVDSAGQLQGQHLLQMLQKVDIANPSAPEAAASSGNSCSFNLPWPKDSVEGDFQDGLAED